MLCVLLSAAVVLSLKRPDWYRPGAIDYAHLEEDKRALVGLYDRISAALNAGRTAEIRIDQAQLNRWIAANAELWPELAPRFAVVDQPMIRFADAGRVEVAATFSQGEWRSVGSAVIRVAAPDRLRGHVVRLQVGSLSVPAAWLWPMVRSRLEENARHGVEFEGDGLAVFNEWVWENGRVPFRVSEIEVQAGEARLVLAPLRAK